MAETDTQPKKSPRRRGRAILRAVGWTLLGLLGLIVITGLGLATAPGRALLVKAVESLKPKSGLRIDIGRIDGSVYGRMFVHDLRLSDPHGVFLHIPNVFIDWHPTALLQNHLALEALHSDGLTLHRLPRLIDTPDEPDKPLFPEIDITLGSLVLERAVIDKSVAGQQHILAMSGSGLLRDQRLQVRGLADTMIGDRLTFNFDAEPEKDKLDISVQLEAPLEGFIAGMLKLKDSMYLTVDGMGRWSRWDGTARGRLGQHELLNLRIAGRSGRFAFSGSAAPAPLLKGFPARLLAGTADVNITAEFEKPRLGFDVRLAAPAIALTASGGLDTEASRWQAVNLEMQLLRPGVALEGMHGRDIRFALAIDGPMATPTVGYKLTASALGFKETVFHGIEASGRATVAGEQWSIPLHVRAATVTGVDEAVGGLLKGLRVDGVAHVTPAQLLADNLVVRSDRLTGKAVVAVTFATGDYNVALEGRTNRFAIPGLGLFDLNVESKLARQPGTGELLIEAGVRAQAVQLENKTVRDFLGGLPTITGRMERLPDGTLRIHNARVQAPDLQMAVRRALYRPDGTVVLEGQGTSRSYGPFSVAVSGQARQPRVRLALASPGLGLGLRDVTLNLTPGLEGYRIAAEGASPHGPFSALARLGQERGATIIDVEQLRFAGLSLAGRLRQTAAGPFAGTLNLTGAGLNGQLLLAAEGRVQRVDANLTARQARPLPAMPLFIGQGTVRATVRLPEGEPSVAADLALRNVRYANWRVDQSAGSLQYQAGRGEASLTARGRSGTPFDLAMRGAFQPNEIRLTLAGNVARRQIRTANPAVLTRIAGGWQLAPTGIDVEKGRIELQGRTGPQAAATAQLSNVDLTILDLLQPELGLAGLASGTVRVTQTASGRMPEADARLVIRRLRRSSLASVSEPVDLGLNGVLSERQGAVRAVVRHEGAIVGRVQAVLTPGAGADWRARLVSGGLQAGVRYNGPAELLWALGGLADHELAGPISVIADATGSMGRPVVSGTISSDRLAYENTAFGTRIRNIALRARFQGSRLEIASLAGVTPQGGRVAAQGYVDLAADRGFPMNVRVALSRALVASTDRLQATVTGPLAITHGPRGGLVSGTLRIAEARYRLGREAVAEIPQLEVRRFGQEPLPEEAAAATPPLASTFAVDMRLLADNRIFVEGLGLESEWEADIRVAGNLAEPRMIGSTEIIRGTYAFAGRRFDVTRGQVRFAGLYPPVPTVDIVASASVDGVTASITVTGTAEKPQIGFASTPALPQDEILSRLLFGNSITELSATEALQLGAAVASLRGGGGEGFNPLGKIRRATDIDRLRILGADERTGRGTSLAVGKYLGDNIYLEVLTDAQGNTLTQLEIQLSRALSVLSQVGRLGTSSLQLQYAKDY